MPSSVRMVVALVAVALHGTSALDAQAVQASRDSAEASKPAVGAGAPTEKAVRAALKDAKKRGDLTDTKGEVFFDHSGCLSELPAESSACTARRKISLSDGDIFAVVIYNTQKDAFVYSIDTVAREEKVAQPQSATKPVDVVTLVRQHSSRYAGYIVHITPIGRVSTTLGEARVIIDVVTSEFRAAFGGGFTASGLTDRVFAVVADTIEQDGTRVGVQRFVREADREDDARLGLGSFVHIHHTRVPWAALTFGLGIEQNRAASYYLGPSLRMGDAAVLTLGVLVGSVRVAPLGVSENQIVADPNVVNNAGSRTKASWFVGLSYSFIGGADRNLAKPFGGEAPTTVAAPSASGGGQSNTGNSDKAAAALVESFSQGPLNEKVGKPVTLQIKYKATAPKATSAKWTLEGCTDDTDPKPVWGSGEGGGACSSAALPMDDEKGANTTVTFSEPGTYKLRLRVGGGQAGETTAVIAGE
jgi:hypothetical protein